MASLSALMTHEERERALSFERESMQLEMQGESHRRERGRGTGVRYTGLSVREEEDEVDGEEAEGGACAIGRGADADGHGAVLRGRGQEVVVETRNALRDAEMARRRGENGERGDRGDRGDRREGLNRDGGVREPLDEEQCGRAGKEEEDEEVEDEEEDEEDDTGGTDTTTDGGGVGVGGLGYVRLPGLPQGAALRTMKLCANWLTWGCLLAALVAIPLYSYDLYRHGKEREFIAWFSAGAFVFLTIPIAAREIYQHLTHWYRPSVQKYVVRILWMVPLYAVESWLSLRFKDFAIYIETIREAYEAYMIFCFLYFLIAVLGEEAALIQILMDKPRSRGQHPFPLNYCFRPWRMGYEFLINCKLGVLQYVIVKNILAVLTCMLELNGVYNEGDFALLGGYLWVTLINNLSQMAAMYCLVMFYFATKEELEPVRPVGKFVCVKAVVFFTWWQSVVIAILQQADVLHGNGKENWTGDEIAKGLQDYLITVEMFVAAIAHRYTFTYKDYRPTDNVSDKQPFMSAFLQSSLPDDVFRDIGRAARGHYSSSNLRRGLEEDEGSDGGDAAAQELTTL